MAAHGTEARSRKHYRDGGKPCPACGVAAMLARRARSSGLSKSEAQSRVWELRRAGVLPPRRTDAAPV